MSFIRILIVGIGLALLIPAPVALLAPPLAASAYGISANSDQAQGYLIATSVRDVALGVWLLSLLVLGAGERVLAASLWSISVVAAGDALNVAWHTQFNNLLALVPHLGGMLVLGVTGWWLWRPQPAVPHDQRT